MMTQGDSIYDIVDKKDHQTVQNELLQNYVGGSMSANQRSFFCRMNVSRAFRRQSGIGDHKVRLCSTIIPPSVPPLPVWMQQVTAELICNVDFKVIDGYR